MIGNPKYEIYFIQIQLFRLSKKSMTQITEMVKTCKKSREIIKNNPIDGVWLCVYPENSNIIFCCSNYIKVKENWFKVSKIVQTDDLKEIGFMGDRMVITRKSVYNILLRNKNTETPFFRTKNEDYALSEDGIVTDLKLARL